jgi:hypothetical protein
MLLDWTILVPNEVVNLIIEINGIQRIQSLYHISEKA